MKTIAVIVTFNRKELLVRNLSAILSQKCRPDEIIIIDNNSSDGTCYYVLGQDFYDERLIKIVRMDENTGGAGGFYHGIKNALSHNADFIILMDDDGMPYNENTFKSLIEFSTHSYRNVNKKIFINCIVTYDGKNPSFGNLNGNIKEFKTGENTFHYIENQANPFNGTLISKEVVNEIGLPNIDFFIINDEMDYFSRCKKGGVYIATVLEALYVHPKQAVTHKKFLLWHLSVFNFPTFKLYYDIRNKVYYLKKDGNAKKLIKDLVNRFFSIILFEKDRAKKIKTFLIAVHDGNKGNLGKRF